MVEHSLINNLVGECEQLLEKVVGVYLSMQNTQQQLKQQLEKNHPASRFEEMDIITRLSKTASNYDSILATKLASIKNITPKLAALLQRRHQILEELHKNNQALLGKAENVKALLQHQMVSLKTNNRALDGYRSRTARGGKFMTTKA